VVFDCIISYAGQEYTGAVGIQAGYNARLMLVHNTITDLPYGAISVGAGAARAGYAHSNIVAYNSISRFMLKMVDSAGVYVTGRQPGSQIHHNYISDQGEQHKQKISRVHLWRHFA
jgi:malic enzyme